MSVTLQKKEDGKQPATHHSCRFFKNKSIEIFVKQHEIDSVNIFFWCFSHYFILRRKDKRVRPQQERGFIRLTFDYTSLKGFFMGQRALRVSHHHLIIPGAEEEERVWEKISTCWFSLNVCFFSSRIFLSSFLSNLFLSL